MKPLLTVCFVVLLLRVNHAQNSLLEPDELIFSTTPPSTLMTTYGLNGVNLQNGFGIGILNSSLCQVGNDLEQARVEGNQISLVQEAVIPAASTILNFDNLTFKVQGINQALEQWQIGRLSGDPTNTLNPFTISRINIAEGGGASFNTALRIDPTSLFIGIQTNPDDALDVLGDIDATGCIQTNNFGSIGGTCISDERFKTHISTLESQLSTILALRPVRFDWKDPSVNGGKADDMGLIAQEVEKVIPEMVVTDEHGYKRVRYDIKLQMRMIKALQEQQQVLDEQKEQIQKQEVSIAGLEKKTENQAHQITGLSLENLDLKAKVLEQQKEIDLIKTQFNQLSTMVSLLEHRDLKGTESGK